MAKFNPGLFIVLLLAGFAVFAFASNNTDANQRAPSDTTKNILVYGGIGGLIAFLVSSLL